MNVLHAVIRPTTGQDPAGPPREGGDLRDRAAHEALALAAERQGLTFAALPENQRDGSHWSVSRTDAYVGGATAPWPVGIDVESLGDSPTADADDVASEAELEVVRSLFGEDTASAFARLRSAKEALLKLMDDDEDDDGLARVILSPLADREERQGLWLRRGHADHFVHQLRQGEHVASVACGPVSKVHWDWQHATETVPPLLSSGNR